MANPRSPDLRAVHWDTVEVLVRLSCEFAVLTAEQVLGCIAKVVRRWISRPREQPCAPW